MELQWAEGWSDDEPTWSETASSCGSEAEDEWGEWPEPWVAHDEPERPLAYGAWLCDCEACALALQATALHEPRLPIVLKTGSDRVVVTAEYADQVWATMGGLEPLCYVRRDYLREVFVGQWTWWNGSDRWWSLTRSQQVKSKRGGLPRATRSTARMFGFHEVEHPRVPKELVRGLVVDRRRLIGGRGGEDDDGSVTVR
jgi:hypothetical protein